MAIGVVGLSFRDACSLTLEEFNAVYEEWDMLETSRYQAGWEQARFIAHCGLMPNVKRGFSPMDLVRFEWDKDTNITQMGKPATHEDFERIRKKFED